MNVTNTGKLVLNKQEKTARNKISYKHINTSIILLSVSATRFHGFFFQMFTGNKVLSNFFSLVQVPRGLYSKKKSGIPVGNAEQNYILHKILSLVK